MELGYYQVAMAMFDRGVSVSDSTTTNNESPLFVAILFEKYHLVDMLISRGAPVNTVESVCQFSPLLMAVCYNHERTVTKLLAAGADVTHVQHQGRSAMFIAVERGYVGIVRLLLEKKHWDINSSCCSTNMLSALHVAAKNNQCTVLRVLLEFGADLDQRDELNRTALDIALANHSVAAKDLILDYLQNRL